MPQTKAIQCAVGVFTETFSSKDPNSYHNLLLTMFINKARDRTNSREGYKGRRIFRLRLKALGKASQIIAI